MSDNGSSISGPRGLQTPATRPQNTDSRLTGAPGGRTSARAGQNNIREQVDLDNAFGRLDTLLSKDQGSEPRSDVPSRGFYLNILV